MKNALLALSLVIATTCAAIAQSPVDKRIHNICVGFDARIAALEYEVAELKKQLRFVSGQAAYEQDMKNGIEWKKNHK